MPSINDRLEEATRWADRVSERVTYPVRDAKQLAAAVGDDDSMEVEYAGRKMSLGQIKKMLPDAFFPVESREDLIARIGHLETRTERPEPAPKGEQRKEAPADAGEPPELKQEPRRGGFPGIRGHGKRQQ